MKNVSESSLKKGVKKENFIQISMARKNQVDLIPLGLLAVGAYLLGQQNPVGWLLLVLGIYVLFRG